MSPGTLTSFLLYTIYIATGLSVLSGLISEWMQVSGCGWPNWSVSQQDPHNYEASRV